MFTSEKDLRAEIWEDVRAGFDVLHEDMMVLFNERMEEEGLTEVSDSIKIALENYYWLIRNCLKAEILEENTDEKLPGPIGGNTFN